MRVMASASFYPKDDEFSGYKHYWLPGPGREVLSVYSDTGTLTLMFMGGLASLRDFAAILNQQIAHREANPYKEEDEDEEAT